MAYKSEKIGTVILDQANRNLFLPDIQREFVWSPDKILRLFDSVMRRYPISSFLFWKVGDDLRNHVDVYQFLQDYREGQVHVANIATNGVADLALVLDGQQRLTSLLIGLRGSFTMKKKWKRRKSADAWQKKRLYLNLLKNPEDVGDDGELGIRYGFEFFEDAPANSLTEYWIPVGAILDYPDFGACMQFKYAERTKLPPEVAADMEQLRVFETNLDRLYQAIWADEAISYHNEIEQDSDRVLDIFVRTNDGGVQLSKSDLLLSMITANWGDLNARAEIQGLVERLNWGLVRRNDFNKDFILKTCLMLCGFNVRYKVENFKGANLDTIEERWADIKASIEGAIKLINAYGIDRDTLTSANAVIPVIHYIYKSGNSGNVETMIGSNGVWQAQMRHDIRRWLILAMLGQAFGRSSDDVLTRARAAIDNHVQAGNADFPFTAINNAIGLKFDIEDFLDINYGDRTDFLALSLLYDQDNWGLMAFERDHIFPQSQFWYHRLASSGLSETEQEKYREAMNSIANLQLLTGTENAEKSGKDFEAWLRGTDPGYRDRHLIPQDDSLLKVGRFLDFIDAREQLIRNRIASILP